MSTQGRSRVWPRPSSLCIGRCTLVWPPRVEVRDDSTGVMVSNGNLLIAPTAVVPSYQVQPLLHHEIGTHIVTHVNGSCQPLRLLGAGLAGYDETQEGLAVLAEHLAGGLTAPAAPTGGPGRRRPPDVRRTDVPAVHRNLRDSGVSGAKRSRSRSACSVLGVSPRMRCTCAGYATSSPTSAWAAIWSAVARQDGAQRCTPDHRTPRPRRARASVLVPRYLADTVANSGWPRSPAEGPGRLDRRSNMRIGFVVNDVHTEQPQYTTTRLAMAAAGRVTRSG